MLYVAVGLVSYMLYYVYTHWYNGQNNRIRILKYNIMYLLFKYFYDRVLARATHR